MDHQHRHRAPGRVNLIGEHTDYTGGLVMPAAIDRSIDLDGVAGGDRIRLTSADVAGSVDVPADGSRMPDDGWGRFVAAVAAELAALGRAPVGLTGTLSSDLPRGAGLSSSAALEVAVATALLAAAGFELPALEIAAACRRAEHRAVGVPSGIMDQAASLLGRADHAVLLDCGTLDHRLVPLPRELAIVILDSNVNRTLAGSGYARRRDELEAGLVALRGRRAQDVGAEELDGLIAAAGLDDVPARRLRHLVTENARVLAVEEALIADRLDRRRLGELFAAGHASLRDDFEVSVPELDRLVELAYDEGAVAARMTGGGFGGAVVTLVDAPRAQAVGAAVADRYAASMPGREATVHHCHAADGARQLDG